MRKSIRSRSEPHHCSYLCRLSDPSCLILFALYSTYYVFRFYEPNQAYLKFNYVFPAILIIFSLFIIAYFMFFVFSSHIYRAALSALSLILGISTFSFLHEHLLEDASSWLRSPILTIASNEFLYLTLGTGLLVASAWYSIRHLRTHLRSSIGMVAASCPVAWILLYSDLDFRIPNYVTIETISACICLLMIASIIAILHHRRFSSESYKTSIKVIISVLLAMNVTVFIQLLPKKVNTAPNPRGNFARIEFNQPAAEGNNPDIVYILLDGMGREDSMKRSGLNISNLSKDLESLGFFVPSKSMSSYMATDITLASVFNYDFASNLGIKSREGSRGFIQNNRLFNLLRSHHYRAFSRSQFYFGKDISSATNIDGADTRDGEFASGLLNQTIYLALRPFIARQFQYWYSVERFDQFYSFTNESIQSLRDDRYFSDNDPSFIFIHLLYAHVPLVFNADGTFRIPEGGGVIDAERSAPIGDRISALQGQIDYLNKTLISAIRECLAHRKQKRPIVFFLQGDHGPHCLDDEGRKTAFAAYYWPDNDYSFFRQDATPVQASRVLMKRLFLPDLDTTIVDDPSPSPGIRSFCPRPGPVSTRTH